MPNFMEQALDHAQRNAPDWLQGTVRQGRQLWEQQTLPTRKTEAWKYTGVHNLRQPYSVGESTAVALKDLSLSLPDLDACRLVFINGHYRSELSSEELPAGIELVRFAQANAAQAAEIAKYLGTIVSKDDHLFSSLNDASLTDGVFLSIAPGVVVDKPIQLVWITASQTVAFTTTQRLLVLAGANSSATVIEHFAGVRGEQATFTNGMTELLVQAGATLEHYRLHLEEGAAMHVGGVHARLLENATLNTFHLALGSVLKRIDVVVDFQGPGAHCEMNGVYLPRGEEHIDYHTCVEHAVPHCTTSETFRGIVGDSASAVFNGRIHIHKDAQKTRAELSNRNLLTSTRAEVNTKPELEIYADDVQCAHGATVAQLDEGSLHYLRTRGVPKAEAEVMLSFGFINEVVDNVRLDELRAYLRPLLAHRFSRDPQLARHLT